MTRERAEAEATRKAMHGGSWAVWATGKTFTVHRCGQDHPGEIVYPIIALD